MRVNVSRANRIAGISRIVPAPRVTAAAGVCVGTPGCVIAPRAYRTVLHAMCGLGRTSGSAGANVIAC